MAGLEHGRLPIEPERLARVVGVRVGARADALALVVGEREPDRRGRQVPARLAGAGVHRGAARVVRREEAVEGGLLAPVQPTALAWTGPVGKKAGISLS